MTGNTTGTHHVDDLLQSQPELELDGLGLVVDRPLQLVVLLHQRVQQPPLRFPAIHLQQTNFQTKACYELLCPSSSSRDCH